MCIFRSVVWRMGRACSEGGVNEVKRVILVVRAKNGSYGTGGLVLR
jgi:hypothetical protein